MQSLGYEITGPTLALSLVSVYWMILLVYLSAIGKMPQHRREIGYLIPRTFQGAEQCHL